MHKFVWVPRKQVLTWTFLDVTLGLLNNIDTIWHGPAVNEAKLIEINGDNKQSSYFGK